MPREIYDPLGYARRSFRLEKKWMEKIAEMSERPDGSHSVVIHLKNGVDIPAIVVSREYIAHPHNIPIRDDDEILDVTSE